MSVSPGDPSDRQPPEPAEQLFLDSRPLLGRDIWAENFALAKLLPTGSETRSASVHDLQFAFDLEIDRFLLATLTEELTALATWRSSHPEHGLGTQVDDLVSRRSAIGQIDQVEAQIALYDWATERPSDSAALTIAGWRRSSVNLATELLQWARESNPDDLRVRHLSYWLDSPGYFPQTRLKVWAYRFPADQRSIRILAAERRIRGKLAGVNHPLGPGSVSGRTAMSSNLFAQPLNVSAALTHKQVPTWTYDYLAEVLAATERPTTLFRSFIGGDQTIRDGVNHAIEYLTAEKHEAENKTAFLFQDGTGTAKGLRPCWSHRHSARIGNSPHSWSLVAI